MDESGDFFDGGLALVLVVLDDYFEEEHFVGVVGTVLFQFGPADYLHSYKR